MLSRSLKYIVHYVIFHNFKNYFLFSYPRRGECYFAEKMEIGIDFTIFIAANFMSLVSCPVNGYLYQSITFLNVELILCFYFPEWLWFLTVE